ncbi:MAG: hypothetical protein PUA62_03375, partial [Lachnospiraceae bacterium]|nr:hypothetical protein [Lachnospiraceae bacterium]
NINGTKYKQSEYQYAFDYSCCCATAASIFWSIILGKTVLAPECHAWDNSRIQSTWYQGKAPKKINGNYYNEMLKILQSDKPCLVHYQDSYGNEHWVTVIGIANDNTNDLSSKSFLCVDPYTGTTMSLADSMKGQVRKGQKNTFKITQVFYY